MYIKLHFKFVPWVVPQVASGINAILINKPDIVAELPPGTKANVHTKKLRSLMKKDMVQATYYLDCEELVEEQVETVLESFAAHYHHYADNKLPGTRLTGLNPENNEIILNLKVAVENVRFRGDKPFLHACSEDDGQKQLMSAFV